MSSTISASIILSSFKPISSFTTLVGSTPDRPMISRSFFASASGENVLNASAASCVGSMARLIVARNPSVQAQDAKLPGRPSGPRGLASEAV